MLPDLQAIPLQGQILFPAAPDAGCQRRIQLPLQITLEIFQSAKLAHQFRFDHAQERLLLFRAKAQPVGFSDIRAVPAQEARNVLAAAFQKFRRQLHVLRQGLPAGIRPEQAGLQFRDGHIRAYLVHTPERQQRVRPGPDIGQDRPQFVQMDQHLDGIGGGQSGNMTKIRLHPAVQGLAVQAGGEAAHIPFVHGERDETALINLPEHPQPVVLAFGLEQVIKQDVPPGCAVQRPQLLERVPAAGGQRFGGQLLCRHPRAVLQVLFGQLVQVEVLPIQLFLEQDRPAEKAQEPLRVCVHQLDEMLFVVDDGVNQDVLLVLADISEVNGLEAGAVKLIHISGMGG